MKCLIIAAGQGLRIKQRGDSKPLITLLEVSLIEHNILTGLSAGIKDFIVVTGYKHEKIQEHLKKIASKYSVEVTVLHNQEWKKENGISVLTAEKYLNNSFILLMADHVISANTILSLTQKPIKNNEIILAVDFKMNNPMVDIEDVTKVATEGGLIRQIGKHLTHYNAYDTGTFFCSPIIFDALVQAKRQTGSCSLSSGIQVLAAQSQAKVYDIGNSFWIDVDTPEMLDKAKTHLAGNALVNIIA